ncbi:type II toxin-antitoxin system Phd/YefM family antitoxin [Candidatus Peregrinibacteria bacterium]|jgi:prevent-host-death family protein|nr:type II toxin-antitoxin system Phd/YefM family antitoxin [Candidatus Peregrinibacteria bacterium]
MVIYTPTQARNNFFQLSKKIQANEEIRVTFKSGDAVIVNSDDYDNLLETLYVLSDPVVSHQLQNKDSLEVSSYSTLNNLRDEMDS